MHDLDRALFESERDDGETEASEEREFLEILGEIMAAGDGRAAGRTPGGADTAREIALASELLEVQSEQELEQFLGDLIRRAAGAARGLARSKAGRALRGLLKDAAGRALPALGRAVGASIDPGYGDTGEHLGRTAGSMLGLELEGLSHEDREFEVARAFVRFADAATHEAAAAERSSMPAARIAQRATETAAREHLPGLATGGPDGGGDTTGRGGRWVRVGDRIVLHGT